MSNLHKYNKNGRVINLYYLIDQVSNIECARRQATFRNIFFKRYFYVRANFPHVNNKTNPLQQNF